MIIGSGYRAQLPSKKKEPRKSVFQMKFWFLFGHVHQPRPITCDK